MSPIDLWQLVLNGPGMPEIEDEDEEEDEEEEDDDYDYTDVVGQPHAKHEWI